MDKVTQYLNQLTPRDRFALLVLSAFVGVIIILYGFLLPANRYAETSLSHYQQQKELLAWMQANEETARAKANQSSQAIDRSQSLLTVASSTAKAQGISFKRFEPQGDNALRIWLDQVSFNDMLLWLNSLTEQQGIEIRQINIDRREAGVVNTRLVLAR